LQIFKNANAEPLLGFILQTPKHKSCLSDNSPTLKSIGRVIEQRSSPRLKEKGKASKSKSVLKMAQELVAKNVVFLKKGNNLIT
jgi:hypothetical protein